MARAISPVVGIVFLLAVAVALAGVVALAVLGSAPAPSPSPVASVDLTVHADSLEIVLTHAGGDPIDVEALELTVSVDGRPIPRQPPVPYVGATGFNGAPTGPFNDSSDPLWSVGETASFRLAASNAAGLRQGSTVEVSLAVDGRPVVTVETTAR